MPKRGDRIDLMGRRFDKLTVVAEVGRTRHRKVLWLCQCQCGNHISKTTLQLCHHRFKTMGCRECAAKAIGDHNRTHGLSRTPLYEVWKTMHARCGRVTCRMYRWYGAKGIRVCDEWEEYQPFHDWAMNHGYRKGLTIERVNGNGNYEPSNCEWITRVENTKRMNAALGRELH
jgi:hypothetical protein